jgi:hypothetical protein
MYIHGREKVLSSGKIMTVRLNMSTTARNNIHLYPVGYANSYCFNPDALPVTFGQACPAK